MYHELEITREIASYIFSIIIDQNPHYHDQAL